MEHATADPASSSAAAAAAAAGHYYTPYPQHPPHPQLQSLPPPHYYSPYQPHYASNPNPSPNPSHSAPPSYTAAPDAAALCPLPAATSYTPDPYAPHGGYEGLYASYQTPPPAAAAASYYQVAARVGETEGQADSADRQHLFKKKNVEMRRAYENLDTKRQKLIKGGASVDSVKVCHVCNVVCNSDTVFAAHLAGGKHALKAAGRSSNGQTPVFPVGIKAKIATAFVGAFPKKPVIRSFYCEVCKIECNRQDILSMHKEGKKHKNNLKRLHELITEKPLSIVTNAGSSTAVDEQNNLKKLQGLIAEKPLNIVTNAGSNTAIDEQPKKKAAQVTVDLEAKRRKVLDSGVAAEEIRTCVLCNVICNSQSVFDSHMVGRKHASMVNNKQQQQQQLT